MLTERHRRFKFNDWASRKLFLIADEVVARSDLYHVKNKLKAFITGEWNQINPKNIPDYEERNHVTLVFLSNERMPVVLEEDDRRHTVIWTPESSRRTFTATSAPGYATAALRPCTTTCFTSISAISSPPRSRR